MGDGRTNPAIEGSVGLRKVLDSSEAAEYLGISYWLKRKYLITKLNLKLFLQKKF